MKRFLFLTITLFALSPVFGQVAEKSMLSANITPELSKLKGDDWANGYSFGVQYGYLFFDNLWLSTGVGYTHKGSKTMKDFKGNVTKQERSFIIDYWEFPLLLNFRSGNFHHGNTDMGKKKKFGFTAHAGVSYGLFYDAKYNFSSSASKDVLIDNNDLKNEGYKNIVSLNMGLGGYYHFTRYVFISFQPVFKTSLTKVPKGSDSKWTSIGLDISIWYRFNRSGGIFTN